MGGPNDIKQVPDEYIEVTSGRAAPVRARGQAMVCTAAQDMRKAKPAAEYHDTGGRYLTGHWSSKQERHYWLHINQAGVWIEGLLIRVGLPGFPGYEVDRTFSGYLHNSNKDSYVLCDDADRKAIIGFFNKEKTGGTWELLFFKPKKRFLSGFDREGDAAVVPTIFPHAAKRLPEIYKLLTWAPPTPGELIRAQQKLWKLDDPIRHYYELDVISESITDKREYQARAEALDAAVGAALPEKRDPKKLPWVPFQARTRLFHDIAIAWLQSWKLTVKGKTDTYYNWIARIVQEAQASGTAFLNPRVPNLSQRLHIRRAPKIQYKATIRIANHSESFLHIMEGKGMAGVLTLERMTDPTWKARFPIAFGGLGLGASKGKTLYIESSGEGWSAGLWNIDDVPGSCMMLDFGVTLIENTFGSTGLAIFGPDIQNQSLNLDLSGWTDNLGAEVGISVSASWGYIGPPLAGAEGDDLELDDDVVKALTPELSEIKHASQNVVHFSCGSALLTEEGRDVVRRMLALDLPIYFKRPETQITITGHADQLDWAEKNHTLSTLRAENTKQAMHDAMWSRLECYDRIEADGKGEDEHRAYNKEHGLTDKSNAAFRRVDIEVEGKLIVKLQAQ